jgi:hypothetical protein
MDQVSHRSMNFIHQKKKASGKYFREETSRQNEKTREILRLNRPNDHCL